MKKALALCALLAMLAVPTVAFADPAGIYVAPKFVYGFTQVDSIKLHSSGTDAGAAYTDKINLGSFDDSAFGGSFAVGYNFKKNFQVPLRLELDYAIFSDVKKTKNSSFTDGGITATLSGKPTYGIQTLFANAYFDIDTGTAFTPYLTGGLGAAFINTKFSGNLSAGATGMPGPVVSQDFSASSKTVTNFAWNVGVGLGYDIDTNWSLDFGYRFVGLGKVRSGDGSATFDGGATYDTFYAKAKNLYMHQIFAGVRYTF